MGRRTLPLARQLSESESLPTTVLLQRQLDSLRSLLRHAQTNCPYYWDHKLPDPDRVTSLNDLNAIPFLTRDALREHHPRMSWANAPHRLLLGHTHGTSDEPLSFIWDRSRQAWDKANRLRGHAWHGFNIGDRELHLWPIDPPFDFAGRFKQRLREHRDALTAESQIDSLALLDGRITPPDAWAQWRVFNPTRVTAYPSALCDLIQQGRDAGLEIGNPDLRAVFLTGEVTFDWQRRLIESALNVPTIQCYGLQEVGAIAFACPRGRWHVCAESAIVEIIRNGRPAQPGELGEIVITGLQSYAMPMIRYRTGDIARAEKPCECPCGRTLPVMPPILGRINDFLETTDGDWLVPEAVISSCSEILPPSCFRITQDSNGDVDVHVVESDEWPINWQARVIQHMRDIVGRFRICSVRPAPSLRRSAFGKCRYVTSQRSRAYHMK
ncbi:MAG: hypothetical protein AABZ08_12845 [Planctomycetota bacterium]